MKVVFRADASHLIGTGHVMRCLTLADALRQHGADSLFLCRAHVGNLLHLIREREFEVVALGEPSQGECRLLSGLTSGTGSYSSWLGVEWSIDAGQAIKAIADWERPDWIVVDHYAIDVQWERMLRPYCRGLMVIDDLADRVHDCDLLLDQNLVADMQSRYSGKLPEYCCQLLGPRYALLQPLYAELHRQVTPRQGGGRRIFVYFGGADAENLTGKTISAFLALGREDVEMDVVINPLSPHAESIRKQLVGVERIHLHVFLPSLANLMRQADVSIAAGGVTTWERCCLGLPSYVITVAENQTAGAMELDRQGVIRWLGSAKNITISSLTQIISDMLGNSAHITLSERGLNLVDGLGCDRVLNRLMASPNSRFRVRLACPDDEALILQWANDPVVRHNSFSSELIDSATHHRWYSRRLANQAASRFFIVETEAGFPVGQARFESLDQGWEINYAIDACMRGRGIGSVFLGAALLAFRNSIPHSTQVLGRVKTENIASQNVFKRLGFVEESDGGDLIYRLSIR